MIALPVVFLLLLELGLRLGGYGESYPLFVGSGQPEYLVPNPEVGKRYFPEGSFLPAPALDFFRAQRSPETFRIVFQGGSSAEGFPYRHGGAPSRMLEHRLQETFRGRDVEVVNTAMTAVNSHTLLDQADEIIEQRPDAVMIYAGHNEYYGVFGVGSTQWAGRSRALVRAYLALRDLRIVQLLNDILPSAAGPQEGGVAPRSAMELMAGNRQITLGSPAYQRGMEQFRANLAELLSRYQEHGVPVFIGTVASNERDQAPLISGLAPGADSAAWTRNYRKGVAALQRGDTRTAETALRAAFRIDSTAADGLYALGKLLDARGEYAQARSYYRAAKEHDQLRFRAPEAINRIIREEAARHGATVVETQQALERAAPGGIIGSTLMLEHLHPTIEGYFVIADAFYEALRKKGMIGPWEAAVPAKQARREIPVTGVDSLVGLFRADRVRSGWPFQPSGVRLTPAVDTLRPRTPEERLAQALVHETIPWPEAMDRLRKHHESTGNLEQALRPARALAQEYSPEAEPHRQAGRIALALGRYDDALRYIRAANEREESPQLVQLAGLLLLRQGDHAAGVRNLRRSAQLAPGDRRMRIALVAAEAIPDLERKRASTPRDTDVLFNLATAYALTRQYEKSKETLAALQQVDPEHAGARELRRQFPAQAG